MIQELKEEIRGVLGEGKLYEVHQYNGHVSYVLTKEREFDVSWTLHSFFEEVTDKMESPIIREIHSIFNCEIRILGYCTHYSHPLSEKVIFKKDEHYDMFGHFHESCIADTDCTYIVCTPHRKSKITNWNNQDGLIDID